MPFQDMINEHIPASEKAAIVTLIDQLETALQPYMRNLSPVENNKVGKISEKNKLFVNKDLDYHTSQPSLDSPDVDWIEFVADYTSRQFYEKNAMRLMAFASAMTETRRLHDYDNYQNALLDYKYAQYKDSTEAGIGYDSKVAELGQFFAGGGKSSTDDNFSNP